MRLGVLQCGHVPDEVSATDGAYGSLYGALFAHRNIEVQVWSVVDGDFPTGPDAADAWLVSGSRHGAYEPHGWIPPLEDLIRAIVAAERPLIGVCFGHQIVAQALGARVEKYAGGWQVGLTEYAIGNRTLALNAWHQDQVVALPDGATVLGRAAQCDHAVLAFGPSVLTVQPHPEFPRSVVETLLKVRSDGLPEDILHRAHAALDWPDDNRVMADWMADVLGGADARAGLP